MRQRRHPLSGAMYEVGQDGKVTVTTREGVSGIFTPDGEWVSGELRQCDAHLAGWLAGPQVPPRLAVLPRFRETASASAPASNGSQETSR